MQYARHEPVSGHALLRHDDPTLARNVLVHEITKLVSGADSEFPCQELMIVPIFSYCACDISFGEKRVDQRSTRALAERLDCHSG